MLQPLISCVIPVHNGAKYLAEALDSVLGQTYRPIEIVVIDDGSTDDSAAISLRYPEVRCIRQENAGPAAARNRGIDEAGSDFLAFLDADDLWHREKLTSQMARLQERPGLEVCTCKIENFWTPELADQASTYRDPRIGQVYTAFVMQAVLARRSAFQRVGSLNPAFRTGEDSDWFMRAEDMALPIEVVPEVLVYRRLHPGNLTRQAGSAVRDNLLLAVRRSLNRRRQGAAAAAPATATRRSTSNSGN